MFVVKNYGVDVWLWLVVWINLVGLVEDWLYFIFVKLIEDVVEYEVKGVGIIYIKKNCDVGGLIYCNLWLFKEKGVDCLFFFEVMDKVFGSVVDVVVKGSWWVGEWCLEMFCCFDIGNLDDVVFEFGGWLVG